MKDILKALRDGEVVIGTVCNIEHPQVLEIIGYSGWDYVLINTEDSTTSPYGGSLDNMVRAAFAAGITPMSKILMPDVAMVYKSLNFGIKIIHASIKNRSELETLTRAVKYPPQGTRIAFPFLRNNGFGARPWGDFREEEDASTTIVPLLETVEAMENMEDILSVEGVELATMGPFDLAMNLGGLGAPGVAEKIEEYWRKFEKICKAKGISVMKPVPDVSKVRETVERGCRCIIATADIEALYQWEHNWVTGLRTEIDKLK